MVRRIIRIKEKYSSLGTRQIKPSSIPHVSSEPSAGFLNNRDFSSDLKQNLNLTANDSSGVMLDGLKQGDTFQFSIRENGNIYFTGLLMTALYRVKSTVYLSKGVVSAVKRSLLGTQQRIHSG
jgi:hypothetical protein